MNCVKSGYFISFINIKTLVKHVLPNRMNVRRDRGQVQKLPTERHRSQHNFKILPFANSCYFASEEKSIIIVTSVMFANYCLPNST